MDLKSVLVLSRNISNTITKSILFHNLDPPSFLKFPKNTWQVDDTSIHHLIYNLSIIYSYYIYLY